MTGFIERIIPPGSKAEAFYRRWDPLVFGLSILVASFWGAGIHDVIWGSSAFGWIEVAGFTPLMILGPVAYVVVNVREIRRLGRRIRELRGSHQSE